MSSERSVFIDLIRHGEPEGGTRFRGWRDDPLSELGWAQMWSAVGDARPWDRVVTSPLSRCAHFAAKVGDSASAPVDLEPRLRELGFGAWEGRVPEELYAEDPDAVMNFYADPVTHAVPGGEPFLDFCERVRAAWEALVADPGGRHLLVVAHGGVIRVVLAQVLGVPLSHLFRVEVPFASVSRIRVSGSIPRLVFHGGRP